MTRQPTQPVRWFGLCTIQHPPVPGRYYQVYFDSTDFPKTAPVYLTALAWNGSVLSNTTISATLSSGGISAFRNNGSVYTAGSGMQYISPTGTPTFAVLINGPVKKPSVSPPLQTGMSALRCMTRLSCMRANGNISGSQYSFTHFPYLWAVNPAVLSGNLHYYYGGVLKNEIAAQQGWLGGKPDEGWACYDGMSTFKDLCLITDAATLTSSNNFWRNATSQIIFPCLEPQSNNPDTARLVCSDG